MTKSKRDKYTQKVDEFLESKYGRMAKDEAQVFLKKNLPMFVLLGIGVTLGASVFASVLALSAPMIFAVLGITAATLAIPLLIGTFALIVPVAVFGAVVSSLLLFGLQLAGTVGFFGLMGFAAYSAYKFSTSSETANEIGSPGVEQQKFTSYTEPVAPKLKKSKSQIEQEEFLREHEDSLKRFDDLLERSSDFKK